MLTRICAALLAQSILRIRVYELEPQVWKVARAASGKGTLGNRETSKYILNAVGRDAVIHQRLLN